MSAHQNTPAERMQFVEYFSSHATNVSAACKAFGISRRTFYEWYNNDQAFKDAIEDARAEMKDFGESQLIMLMRGIPVRDKQGRLTGWKEKPDTAAVIFFNKTRNKDRGYSERLDIRPVEPMSDAVDMEKLSQDERQQLYSLLDKAGFKDE